ncbi:MAG: hypothetical protein ACO1OG_09385 [Devosia sp.]
MKKIVSLGLAAVLATGAFAVPAFASDFNESSVKSRLEAQGLNVVDVFGAGKNKVRAVVELADGSEVFQYFYLDGLRPVTNVGGTRVLSEMSTN